MNPTTERTQSATSRGPSCERLLLRFGPQQLYAHVDRVDPEHKKPATFIISPKRKNADPFEHITVKEPFVELPSDQALMVYNAKLRPVVLFSMPPETWNLRSGRPADQGFLCIPAYGLKDYDSNHIAAVRHMKYASLFYLPEELAFSRREAMLRLDRSQIIARDHLVRIKPNHRLTEPALTLLQGWFRYWSTGSPEGWILDYQREQVELLGG